jgi:hypothetical protein
MKTVRELLKLSFALVVLVGLASYASIAIAQSLGTFTPTGNMTTARIGHTATLLRDGRVLIAGGSSDRPFSADLYDPSTATFSATGNMVAARIRHSATLLRDGRVLIAGGWDTFSAELYDPASGTFTSTGNMTRTQEYNTATLLFNGKVLIAGGARDGRWFPHRGQPRTL